MLDALKNKNTAWLIKTFHKFSGLNTFYNSNPGNGGGEVADIGNISEDNVANFSIFFFHCLSLTVLYDIFMLNYYTINLLFFQSHKGIFSCYGQNIHKYFLYSTGIIHY